MAGPPAQPGGEPPTGVGPAPAADQTAATLTAGGGEPLIAAGGATFGTAGHWDFSLWRGSGDNISGAHLSIDGFNNKSECFVTAEVHLI